MTIRDDAVTKQMMDTFTKTKKMLPSERFLIEKRYTLLKTNR